MKYLVSIELGKGNDLFAPEGEPVIPAFPVAPRINRFLSGISFKPTPTAQVVDIDIDIDAFADGIRKEYPGLPGDMIDDYIIAVVKAVRELPLETRVRIVMEEDRTAIVTLTGNLNETIVELWKNK